MRTVLLSLYLVLGISCFFLAQDLPNETVTQENNHKWHFELTPYFWATSIYSTKEIGPVSFENDTRFKDIFENLDYAIPIHFEFGKDDWTVITDFLYVKDQVDKDVQYTIFDRIPEKSTIYFSGDYTVTKLQCEALGAYTVKINSDKNGAWKIDVLLGFRYTSQENSLELKQGSALDTLDLFPYSHTEQYLDPLIGAAYTLHLCNKWKFYFRGDIGGFTVGSDFTSNLIADISYEVFQFMDVNLAYRWLYTNYDNGKTGLDYYSNKSNEIGPILSLTFKW
jgi:hypothetical protein